MADNDKTTVYQITYDVDQALRSLRNLKRELRAADDLSRTFARGQNAPAIKGTDRVRKMVLEERKAREKLNAAIAMSSKKVREYGREAVAAGRSAERIVKADERATRKLTRETDKAARAAVRAREKFNRTFLNIGRGSRSGFLSMIKYATLGTIAVTAVRRAINELGEAKDRAFRFDELTTATMTIAKAGDDFFSHGARGAKEYRASIRAAADEVKTSAAEMADSALFWAKAGQTNATTIAELSKVGTLFARANRDTANNVLNQARANDILSDALTLFRKDTSTTQKAISEATTLADKMTAAANASNMVVEQTFEFTKKVGPLAETGELSEDTVLAIAGSLASAGLKAEEPGRLVRRILTQFGKETVQKELKKYDVELETAEGQIRPFAEIFGEIQNILKGQKPLERMTFLKKIVGQHAISVAAALAGLNEQGEEGPTSINAILAKVEESAGISRRNQEEYLKTMSGRVQALTSTWGNALDRVLEDSSLIQNMLSGLEDIDPKAVFGWVETVVIPALERFGIAMRDVVIPGIKMAGENLYEWFSPALSMTSDLLGGTASNAEGLATTITTLVKLWVKWRIAMLAIKGLRMVSWLTTFTKQAIAAATASRGLATAATGAVAKSKASLNTLPAAFGAVGIAITAAIAAWGLYEALTGPIEDAERRLQEFRERFGEGFRMLKPGDVDFKTLQGRIADVEKLREHTKAGVQKSAVEILAESFGIVSPNAGEAAKQLYAERLKLDEELRRLRDLQAQQVSREYGVGTEGYKVGRYEGGLSTNAPYQEDWGFQTPADMSGLWASWREALESDNSELLQTAQDAYEAALNDQLAAYQAERSQLQMEREETYLKFSQAAGDERAALHTELGHIADRLKDNAESIEGYTRDLDEIAGAMSASREKERTNEILKAVEVEQKKKRGRAFRGREKPLNPFATPLLTGVDAVGDRIVNLALQKGGATRYFQQRPEARQSLSQQLRKQKSIVNIYYGDASITVTAKTDAKPLDIARAVKNEWWKIGKRNLEDVQRVLSAETPGEM
jgi:TP901 family phage tail tape measure protein